MGNKDKTNIRESGILGISHEQDEIFDKIREIVREAPNDEYIYRGQSGIFRPTSDDDGTFPKVTSTLYRALYCKMEKCCGNDALREWRKMDHDMNFAQEGVLEAAREFDVKKRDMGNEDMLSRTQHYSGYTNLIDFTQDSNVALFFACSHKYGKTGGDDGRVFLLKKSKLKGHEIEVINAIYPPNRIDKQSSVFLQSRTGFIPEELMEVVNIPRKLKQSILDDLKKHNGISLLSIYNDLHGYIRSSKEHGDAAMELYLGLDYNYQYNNAQLPKEKRGVAEKAIKHYNEAILLNPKYARAYYSRAEAKKALSLVESAIDDYLEAIKLNSDYAEAYHGCGLAWEMLGNIGNLQEALGCLEMAKKLAPRRNKPDMVDNVQKSIDRVTMKMSNS